MMGGQCDPVDDSLNGVIHLSLREVLNVESEILVGWMSGRAKQKVNANTASFSQE
jgi:hypothetical protein